MVGSIYLAKIKITNDDLSNGQLRKDSLVVVPKNFTLHNSILFKYIANVKQEKLETIFVLFCSEIGCNEV